jgi:hypothetical protein
MPRFHVSRRGTIFGPEIAFLGWLSSSFDDNMMTRKQKHTFHEVILFAFLGRGSVQIITLKYFAAKNGFFILIYY